VGFFCWETQDLTVDPQLLLWGSYVCAVSKKVIGTGAGQRSRSHEDKEYITYYFHTRQATNLRGLGSPRVTSDWERGVGLK